jgi:hypothetical protein
MARKKEPARKGRPPVEIDLEKLAALGAIHCTHEEIASLFNCTRRTILNRLKRPEFLEAYENGKLRGKMNLRRLQWRHAQGLDPDGNYIHGSQSAAVNMTKHLSAHWLGETDQTAVQVNPVEIVITRIERVIVDRSSDPNRQGLPTLIEAQAIQGG